MYQKTLSLFDSECFPLIPSGIWGIKGGNFWVWYFFMYSFLPRKIFNLNLQVNNKRNFRNKWDDFSFWRSSNWTYHNKLKNFPNLWHHWWKEKFGWYEKMMFSLCQEDMNFSDMIPITFCTVSDALFPISGNLFYFTNHWSDLSKTFQELTW